MKYSREHPIDITIIACGSIQLLNNQHPITQWPFQEPKLEVPTIYKVYIRPM